MNTSERNGSELLDAGFISAPVSWEKKCEEHFFAHQKEKEIIIYEAVHIYIFNGIVVDRSWNYDKRTQNSHSYSFSIILSLWSERTQRISNHIFIGFLLQFPFAFFSPYNNSFIPKELEWNLCLGFFLHDLGRCLCVLSWIACLLFVFLVVWNCSRRSKANNKIESWASPSIFFI